MYEDVEAIQKFQASLHLDQTSEKVYIIIPTYEARENCIHLLFSWAKAISFILVDIFGTCLTKISLV